MKMPDKIDNNMFAPCGINCIACYKHLKTKNNCNGCLSDNIKTKTKHCRVCKIKICATEKNHIYCFQCNEFPCKLIKNLEKSYNKRYKESLIKNSDLVKQNSLEYFMILEREKRICKNCDGIISMHEFECSECKT